MERERITPDPEHWMNRADEQQIVYGIGKIRTDPTVLNDGLRYEIRALTMQVRELTELLREKFSRD